MVYKQNSICSYCYVLKMFCIPQYFFFYLNAIMHLIFYFLCLYVSVTEKKWYEVCLSVPTTLQSTSFVIKYTFLPPK